MKKPIAILIFLIMLMSVAMLPMPSMAQNDDESVNVRIEGNGGTFTYEHMVYETETPTQESSTVESCSENVNKGADIRSIITKLNNPVFWNVEREFDGWKRYVWGTVSDDEGGSKDWIPADADETLYTSVGLLDYTPEVDTMFKAQWKGDDSDYYSKVSFNAYGGEFSCYYNDEDGQLNRDEYKTDSYWCSDELRINNETIGQQINNCFEFKSDPKKENSTFQGWIEFAVTVKEYEDGSCEEKYDCLYNEGDPFLSTADVLAQTVPKNDRMYVAKWSDMNVKDYFKDGGDSEFDPDTMILNYTYYDASGECVWQPDMISLIKANDTRMTYGEVIEEAKANAPAAGEHYAGIGGYLKDWKITGTSFGDNYDTTAEAEGGEIYLMADYGGRAIVMTDIAYYDMNKDAVNNSKAVVVERNTYPNGMTYNDVYSLIQADLPNAGEHGYDFLRWELSEDADAIVKGKDDSLWDTDLTDARFQVYAVYKNCPISFVYKYLNNDVVEEKDVKLVIDGNKTLVELFIENIPESIPSKDIYGWAIDPQITWTNYPSAGTQEITGAAQYKTTSSNDNDGWMSPVFTSRQLIAYDEAANEYYIPDQTEEIFYVNVATPDSEDDGQAVKDMESELIKLAGEDVKEFKFQGYEVHYKFIANEKIKESEVKGDYTIYVGPRYALKAIYNNALVILEYPDGEIDNFPMNIPNPDKAPKLDLPAAYKGKDLLWDKGVAFAGGNAILGGTSEPIESPYTKFTTYEVSMNELTEAPEGLNKTLEEVKNEMRETGFSYKHWKSGEIVYLDVELLRKSGQEEWTEVDDSYFPEKGKVIYLPYPEGTDKNTEFVVSHMITSDYHDGKNKGDVEILSCTNCEQGIRIVVNSLSPIAVAYNGEIGDPADPVNPDNAADPTESTKPVGAYDTAEPADSDSADEAAQTGDGFNAGLFIAIMIVAFAGIITVLFKRKHIE